MGWGVPTWGINALPLTAGHCQHLAALTALGQRANTVTTRESAGNEWEAPPAGQVLEGLLPVVRSSRAGLWAAPSGPCAPLWRLPSTLSLLGTRQGLSTWRYRGEGGLNPCM